MTSSEQVKNNIVNLILRYEKSPQDLWYNLIKDTRDERLGRAIKAILARGYYRALVTFNSSKKYSLFALAMLGLTEEEIRDIWIRNRK